MLEIVVSFLARQRFLCHSRHNLSVAPSPAISAVNTTLVRAWKGVREGWSEGGMEEGREGGREEEEGRKGGKEGGREGGEREGGKMKEKGRHTLQSCGRLYLHLGQGKKHPGHPGLRQSHRSDNASSRSSCC